MDLLYTYVHLIQNKHLPKITTHNQFFHKHPISHEQHAYLNKILYFRKHNDYPYNHLFNISSKKFYFHYLLSKAKDEDKLFLTEYPMLCRDNNL